MFSVASKTFRMESFKRLSRVRPQIVLDPFGGSGTTAIVARRLGRDFITVELNQKYINEHIKPRLEETNPLFGSVEVV